MTGLREASFHWVNDMGLEPHQKNFFESILNGILKFLERVFCPRNFSGSWILKDNEITTKFIDTHCFSCFIWVTILTPTKSQNY